MKFLSFVAPDSPSVRRLGVLLDEYLVLDLAYHPDLPESMADLIAQGPDALDKIRSELKGLAGRRDPLELTRPDGSKAGWLLAEISLKTPLAHPTTLRDFYAFEEHVATAHANRGKPVPKEWYEFSVFYFSNPHAVYGPGDDIPMPAYTQALDYELEVAAIIGKAGRDIAPEDALDHIFGFTIFNDWSARDVQRQEMKVGLGPAKGKDFASSFGPHIVTPDELEDCATNRPGVYDLEMVARLNGHEYSRGNWKTLHYSFGDMLARASAEVTLQPGDIIGSGTVGTGCLLELSKGRGPWLKRGDLVELEIERLGILRNRVV